MKPKIKKNSLKVYVVGLYLLIFPMIIVQASELKKDNVQSLVDLQPVIYKIQKAIRTRNFNVLKQYVLNKEPLYWAQCNTDVSIKVSFDKMVSILSESIKNAEIYVNEKPGAGLIETEGWTGEYPYLYFDFTKKGNNWKWLGVCYDMERSLDFAILQGGKDKLYDGLPQLPRPGPRVFEDIHALQMRIIEIIRFKKIDALKPYAIKQKLILGECSTEMINDVIKGKEISIDQVLDFLKKNIGSTTEIKFSTTYKYLDTKGWGGKYPFIYFGFTEGKDGWEWSGVAYCKTSLMKVLFPEEPRFK
jgi:hypothetical protein